MSEEKPEWTEVGPIDFEDETGIVVSQQGDEVRLAFFAEELGEGWFVDLQPWARKEFRRLFAEAEHRCDDHLRALLGKSTAAHWNVGLPGEQAIANAHRREAGLEELT